MYVYVCIIRHTYIYIVVCVCVCLCQFRTWLAFSSFDLNAAAIKQIELKSIFVVMPKLWNCRIMYDVGNEGDGMRLELVENSSNRASEAAD